MTEPTVNWQAPEPVEGPAPGVAFADPGSRLVAYILDVVITVIVVIVLALLGAALVFIAPFLSIIPFVAVVVVPLVYVPWYWSRGGQTPGMKAMGIRVVRDSDGGPVSVGSAILRLIGYWVSGVVFYSGYIWIFVDKRRRGWHDLIAGTVVVKSA